MISQEKHQNSLIRKFSRTQMVTVTVIVLVFTAAFTIYNTYRLQSQINNKVESIVRLAETSLATAVWQLDHASVSDVADAIFADPYVVFCMVKTEEESITFRIKKEFKGMYFGDFAKDPQFITRTVDIKKFGDWIGTFEVAITLAPVETEILINTGISLALSAVLILAIAQTAIVLSRKHIFTPLARLEANATAMANGDMNATIDVSGDDEIANLARSFNHMRDSIQKLLADLRSANTKLQDYSATLEARVRERTEELREKNASLNNALREVEEARRTAEVASLAKSRFLASMSHEIRTPMNAILGMADVLADSTLNKDQKRYVQVFKSAGENLLTIINDILDLSKIEAGKMRIESIAFLLQDPINKARDLVAAKSAEKHLSLHMDIDDNLPEAVQGDPSKLRQILVNLLDNAIKFTEKGAVSLKVTVVDEYSIPTRIRFSVSDTGVGIHPSKINNIFSSFSQADDSTTRKYGGTGLGLAICKQLTQLMGGTIHAESIYGSGSTFHLELPFRTVSTNSVPKNQPEENQMGELPPTKLLLVEDSEYNAFVIRTYLSQTPVALEEATNGREGVERFRTGRYDAVLMDIQMPIMDGYEAMGEIREIERQEGRKRTPIVAMTAYALVGDAEKCIAAGADVHLPKPVKKNELLALLGRIQSSPDARRVLPPSATLADPEIFAAQDDTIHIRPTPGFEEILPKYINSMVSAVDQAFAALDQRDFSEIQILGHTMKGEGAAFGIPEVSDMGRALENSAQEQDFDNTHESLQNLKEYLSKLSVAQ